MDTDRERCYRACAQARETVRILLIDTIGPHAYGHRLQSRNSVLSPGNAITTGTRGIGSLHRSALSVIHNAQPEAARDFDRTVSRTILRRRENATIAAVRLVLMNM